MEDLLAICRDVGAETLELEVLVRNAPAIALYKRCGFAIVDELVVWSRAPLEVDRRPPAAAHALAEREIARVARTPSTCWQREPSSVAAASPCERIVVGHDATPQAYAFVRRDVDRMTVLDVGARDATSAARLLAALDAIMPQASLRLLNEPAHGPLHQTFKATASRTELTRQYRMCRAV